MSYDLEPMTAPRLTGGLLAAFTWMGLYKYWHYRRLVRQKQPTVSNLAPAQGH